jgi:hypothetical protein
MRHVLRALTAAAILLIGVGQGSAHAEVTTVEGSAFGYYLNVGLFGSPQPSVGPTPTVTLPAGGSNVPITATAPTGRASAGPATFFTSGQLNVSTQGTTGATGSVTSSTNIQTVNTSGQEVFTAAGASSTCTASEGAASGSTTISSGTLQADSGDDDPTNTIPDHPSVNVTLPANPAPNTSYDGHIHVNGSTDSFRYVFNEQVVNPDGSITVNAAHEYLLGPTAVGDLIVGQSVCGVTASPDTTPPNTSITSGPTSLTRSTSASLSFTSTEAGSRFQCSLDNASFVDCVSPESYSGLSNGLHTFKVQAIDTAHNTDPTPASLTWRVDTVRPSGKLLINGGKASTTSRTVTLRTPATDPAPASGVASMRLKNAGGSWTGRLTYTTSKSWRLTSGAGKKTVYAQYRDRAGNVSAIAQDSINYKP